MRYQIVHETIYNYSQSVPLEPHVLRLRSRSNGYQSLQAFTLDISPQPTGSCELLDIAGNSVVKIWFQEPTDRLKIIAKSSVETYCTNPFNYVLEPWATTLPIDYPASLLSQLHPYFYPLGTAAPIDPIVYQLAREICHKVENNTVSFVWELNQRIYENCQQEIREIGAPLLPGITWTQQSGSCRDFAVLFMEACRVVGLAARFVSGYQEGDKDTKERHLHAWTEVYLPGAGWRGYDPTQGLAVADRNISLVASAIPENAAPVSGGFRGVGVRSKMRTELLIDRLDEGVDARKIVG